MVESKKPTQAAPAKKPTTKPPPRARKTLTALQKARLEVARDAGTGSIEGRMERLTALLARRHAAGEGPTHAELKASERLAGAMEAFLRDALPARTPPPPTTEET